VLVYPFIKLSNVEKHAVIAANDGQTSVGNHMSDGSPGATEVPCRIIHVEQTLFDSAPIAS